MPLGIPPYIPPIPTTLGEIEVVSGDTYSAAIGRAVVVPLDVVPNVPSGSAWVVEIEVAGEWQAVGSAVLSLGGDHVAWYPGLLEPPDWVPARYDARAVAVLPAPGNERWTHAQFTLAVTA